jgi:hypothetical protein
VEQHESGEGQLMMVNVCPWLGGGDFGTQDGAVCCLSLSGITVTPIEWVDKLQPNGRK